MAAVFAKLLLMLLPDCASPGYPTGAGNAE